MTLFGPSVFFFRFSDAIPIRSQLFHARWSRAPPKRRSAAPRLEMPLHAFFLVATRCNFSDRDPSLCNVPFLALLTRREGHRMDGNGDLDIGVGGFQAPLLQAADACCRVAWLTTTEMGKDGKETKRKGIWQEKARKKDNGRRTRGGKSAATSARRVVTMVGLWRVRGG